MSSSVLPRPARRPGRGLGPLLLSLGLLGAGTLPAAAAGPDEGRWHFKALLDGKPIGEHRYTLRSLGEGRRELRSEASFEVKLLGLTVYRYRHEAVEQWAGDCLVALSSRTDDDGSALSVEARREGEALLVKTARGEERLEGCVMSFAYWHPGIRQQARLLNAQNGRHEPVRFEALGEAGLERASRPERVQRWRLSGPEQPLELAYGPDGDWRALDARVSGGKRLLQYRRD